MNNCQVGHKKHLRKLVNTIIGDIMIYDWGKYMIYPGKYCTGQDAVSQTLEQTLSWDIRVHERIEKLLSEGNNSNVFLDVGCHIGYFSRLASNKGYKIIAFDGDKENLELAKINVPGAKIIYKWFSKDTKPWTFCKFKAKYPEIEVMKIDIEGAEKYAIKFVDELLLERKIKNIVIEVSPVFNDSYPDLINLLVKYGFVVCEIDGSPFNFDYNFEQKDLWLKLS